MAHAILPQDCGSTDPYAEAADLLALAAELTQTEGLNPLEAQSQALALMDPLHAYAVVWDADAAKHGNPEGLPDAPVLEAAPALLGRRCLVPSE